MVQLNLATAVAHSRTIVDHLTRQGLRWQRPSDSTVFPRLADMLGCNWEALVDEDHEAATHENERRAGQLMIELGMDFAGANTRPIETSLEEEAEAVPEEATA